MSKRYTEKNFTKGVHVKKIQWKELYKRGYMSKTEKDTLKRTLQRGCMSSKVTVLQKLWLDKFTTLS